MTASLTRGADFTVEVITELAQLDGLAPRWSSLLSRTPYGSGFQSLGWVRACCEHLSRGGDQLFVMVVSHHGDVVAIFPTQLNEGCLTFVGRGLSNYSGPVYDAQYTPQVVDAWIQYIESADHIRSVDLFGLREGTPLLAVLRSRTIRRLGRPLVCEINSCPEIDLTSGWDTIVGRHKSKQRAGWRKKERRLSALGKYQFIETDDHEQISAAMPRLSSLFGDRWEGQRISGGFTRALESFHTATLKYSRDDRYIRLSMLTLDDEIIAFSYGVRAANVTSSYLLAHDLRFNTFSVGLLLVIRVLEAASRRGDPMYDFSLGSAEYKAQWATGERGVHRVLWGRHRWVKFLSSRAWVRARSVGWLRHLKRHGVGALRGERRVTVPDTPGLPCGASGHWYIHRVAGESQANSSLSPRPYGYISQHLSPQLLKLAIERSFRGDELLVSSDESGVDGVVWRAAESRRATVTANSEMVLATDVVYYHPSVRDEVLLEDFISQLVSGQESCVVVTVKPLPEMTGVTFCDQFSADLSFSSSDDGRREWAQRAATIGRWARGQGPPSS